MSLARKTTLRSILLSGAFAAAALAGCTHIGPRTVPVDRFDYSSAIADSWKQQTLLNIVKLRYMDLPVFVDVASVVAGYSLQTGLTATGVASSREAVQGDYGTISGQAVFTDRPTITYVPMTGEKFLRGMLTPIDPKSIFSMVQSGYPADFILALTVESLNGVRNRSTGAGSGREADPEFLQALGLLREVQASGALGMRVLDDKPKGKTGVLFFRRDDLPADIAAKAAEIRRLLKLATDQDKFTLVYSPVRGAEDELAVNSRSMLQIMSAFASYVDVPAEDLATQSAMPVQAEARAESGPPPVRVHSGKDKPATAYAAVHYRSHWFWIEDGDWRTKRAIMAMMFFFTLTDASGNENVPLITIPAQ